MERAERNGAALAASYAAADVKKKQVLIAVREVLSQRVDVLRERNSPRRVSLCVGYPDRDSPAAGVRANVVPAFARTPATGLSGSGYPTHRLTRRGLLRSWSTSTR